MKKVDKYTFAMDEDEILEDSHVTCECGEHIGFNFVTPRQKAELTIDSNILYSEYSINCPECGEEVTLVFPVYSFHYKASFEQKDYPNAEGIIIAVDRQAAEYILYGMSGTWTDKNGNNFEAGVPSIVEIL